VPLGDSRAVLGERWADSSSYLAKVLPSTKYPTCMSKRPGGGGGDGAGETLLMTQEIWQRT
jgi:hypothetical protein